MTTSKIIIEPRDVGFLADLGENGLLDVPTIHRRHFAKVSLRRCQQRIAVLKDHGLTRTAELRLWCGTGERRAIPTIHMLTERGADVIEELSGNRPRRVSRSDPRPETIYHRLQIVWTKLAIDDACKALGLQLPKWILEQDRDAGASEDLPPSHRRILYHPFPGPPSSCTCQPDAACRMVVPRDMKKPAAGVSDLIGFFEIDCSTEGRKQIVGKLPGYTRLLGERTFRRYFAQSDQAAVRVFWVCQTLERIRSICEEVKSESVAQYFRFATATDVARGSILIAPIWHATDGKRREIVRLPQER